MKLKNYRNLIPIVLIFLIAMASYTMVKDAEDKETQYLSYLAAARENRDGRILADALINYNAAIEMSPSIELYDEVADMLLKLGSFKQRVAWGEQMVTDYPLESSGYEYLISIYLADERYEECFEIYDEVKSRQLLTTSINDMMAQIEYVYSFDYDKYEDIGIYANGYCAVCKDGKWGYIDEIGNTMISLIYREAGVFADGLAYVKDRNDDRYFINQNNDIKLYLDIDEEAEMLGILSEGHYPILEGNEYYFVNEDGEIVAGPYLYASSFNFGKAAVLTEEGWTFVDTAGNKLTDNLYLNVILDGKEIAFRNGRAFVETEEGIRMIDENFAIVGELIFDDAIPFYESGDTYAAVKIGATWGYVNTAGTLHIPCEYAEADSFMNGFGAVCVRDAWGYVNTDGEIVIDTIFEQAAPFNSSKCAFVKEHGFWRLLKLTKYNW